jgi:DNA phosphorothioation-dependent restriction protein DptG
LGLKSPWVDAASPIAKPVKLIIEWIGRSTEQANLSRFIISSLARYFDEYFRFLSTLI